MKIICFGDSNTWGYDPRSYWGGRYEAPWPLVLAQNTGWITVNLGENGREIPASPNQLNRVSESIRVHLPADLLIILLGSNDILNCGHDAERLVEKRMDNFLNALRSEFPDLPILLLASMPMVSYGEAIEQASKSVPDLYRKLAEKHRTSFADCGEWQLPIAYDGLHLTEGAHVLFAERVQGIIQTVCTEFVLTKSLTESKIDKDKSVKERGVNPTELSRE